MFGDVRFLHQHKNTNNYDISVIFRDDFLDDDVVLYLLEFRCIVPEYLSKVVTFDIKFRVWTPIKSLYGFIITRGVQQIRKQPLDYKPMLLSLKCQYFWDSPNFHVPNLCIELVTCNRKSKRVQQVNESGNEKSIKYAIIVWSDAIGDPGTVVIIYANTRLTDLAMPWPLRFHYLVNYKVTPQSKQIRFPLFFIKICSIPLCLSNCLSRPGLDSSVATKNNPTIAPNPMNVP